MTAGVEEAAHESLNLRLLVEQVGSFGTMGTETSAGDEAAHGSLNLGLAVKA